MKSFEILLADGVSADNGAVGAKGCAAFDQSSAIFMLARNVAAVIIDVGEYHAGAAKHVILQRYRVVNTDIVLHFDIAADNDIAADKDVLPEGTALAMHAPPQMCTQCQMRVLSPITAPSSKMAVSCLK